MTCYLTVYENRRDRDGDRAAGGDGARALAQLLTLMDGFHKAEGSHVLVIGATNRYSMHRHTVCTAILYSSLCDTYILSTTPSRHSIYCTGVQVILQQTFRGYVPSYSRYILYMRTSAILRKPPFRYVPSCSSLPDILKCTVILQVYIIQVYTSYPVYIIQVDTFVRLHGMCRYG